MLYTKVKISLKHFEKRLYRVVLIRENMGMAGAALVLGAAVGAEFEHLYQIISQKVCYMPEDFIEHDMGQPIEEMESYR